MATTSIPRTGPSNRRQLGINPEFEGLVVPRWKSSREDGQESRVRDAILFDTAEAAFAYFNGWSQDEMHKWIYETLRYIRESTSDPKKISLPTMERWNAFFSFTSLDQAVEGIWDRLVKGVRQRHEGQDNFLTKHAIADARYEPHRTRGGIWTVVPVRRGDEEKSPAGEITLTNVEAKNGRINVAGMDFTDPTPLSRKSIGRERRHGSNSEIVHIATYPVHSFLYYINSMKPEKKVEMGLPEDYQVIMPFNFKGHEYLVVEAVARRYLPIQSRLNSERNIFAVSNFLNDHPEIFSSLFRVLVDKGSASVGVAKLWFADSPHRDVLESIDDFLTNEHGYGYDGFALDFRQYGLSFQTYTPVYRRPDMTRKIHIVYDGRFKAPPIFLFKMREGEWSRERLIEGRNWNKQDRPERNPFSYYGQWYTDFDRHSQRSLVTRITRPDKFVVDQFMYLREDYSRFEKQGRLALARQPNL